MLFRTEVDIRKSQFMLLLTKPIVLLGSCFADNIGKKLEESKFNTLCNPFGVLYNPMSIARLIQDAIDGKTYNEKSKEIFSDGTSFHSWMHHSSFSASSAKELAERMNKASRTINMALHNAGTIVITFGTSIIYELNSDGQLVANCHKQPDRLFTRRLLSVEEITERWNNLLITLHRINPNLQVIFTVSPIRHKRDGFHANQLSKAALLLAVEQITHNASRTLKAEYFPSYEIMMDELRDYRFYDDDMIHPSKTAVEYIWQQFQNTFIDKHDLNIIKECREIQNILAHRPSNPHSEAYLSLIQKTQNKINQLKNRCPYISMDSELELCNTILTKSHL